MAKITNILGQSTLEQIEAKVASILATEITNQKLLLTDAIAEETNPAIKSEMQLTFDSLPDIVWEDRFLKPNNNEVPYLNVCISKAKYEENNTILNQVGIGTIIIEAFAGGRTLDTLRGDYLASKKLYRLLAVCRQIIQDSNYMNFELVGKVSWRFVSDIKIAQPETAKDSENNIYGTIEIKVKYIESVGEYDGFIVEQNDTTVKFNDTEKGFFWISRFAPTYIQYLTGEYLQFLSGDNAEYLNQ